MTNIPFEEKVIREKIGTINFRGPDYSGVEKLGRVSLGHLRLAIIDLDNRSNQPMQYDDYSIVFNGEIYNYKDIREELISLGYSFTTSSDTEVLLKGFKEWGKDIIPKLNGMFAFAIYNQKENTIFCSRDRLGVKPFYYYWKDGTFEICSQLRPIAYNNKLELNDEAISIFLDCTYIPSPYTIYKDVYKLSPGNNLEINLNDNKLTISEYWNLSKVHIKDISYDEAKDKLHELLKDAIKIRLQSDVPFGSFLSGGVDSALISSIAARVADEPIKTFSIGFEDPKYDESKVAAIYAKIINSEHTETICKPEDIMVLMPKLIQVYDEPFADSSALPSLLLNKVTKQYVTMALSGDGGDESFLGYNHFDWMRKIKKLYYIPYFLRNIFSFGFISNIFGKRTAGFKSILSAHSINDAIGGIFFGYNSLLQNRNFRWFNYYGGSLQLSDNIIQRTADLNIKLWLENDSNVKVDRASMAYSVEVRSPFLDYRVVEFARTLPISYRYKPGRKKRILKDILKEYIPEEVFNLPKKGFSVPIGSWIRNELREEFLKNLSDDFLSMVPNLNIPKFKKMLKLHLDGKYDYASYIWRVYILSKWYQEFGYYTRKED